MLFHKQKQVDISRDLPADIHSAYLQHSIHVTCEQTYMTPTDRTEPTLEQLTDLCNAHCDSIFAVTKWTQSNAYFRFYWASDLHQFILHLQSLTVANDHSDLTQ
jgi:hypothetical protein